MRDYQDVHEKDYGGPGAGGILLGIIEIIWGLVEIAIWAWRRRRD